MPRSKRNKQVELAKTKKRGIDFKKRLMEEIRYNIDKYQNLFIFTVNDMRNNKMKYVREQWKDSRFFIGKNKVMAKAIGRFEEEEYRAGSHKIGQQIKGQRGLLFSNKSIEEVLSWFRSYSEGDYARSGNTATETVSLPAGPLTMFPHNLEPYLRELGLPTTLEKGVIHLVKDHEVCKAGDVLTPETAKILKLLGYEMAEFHIRIDSVWSKDGTFMQLTEKVDTDAIKNKKQVTENNNAGEEEQMEIEQNEESSDGEVIGLTDDDDDDDDVEESATNSLAATSSTPKSKNSDVIDMSDLKEKDSQSTIECNKEEISEKIENKKHNGESLKEIDGKNHMKEVEENSNKTDINEEKVSRRGRSQMSAKTPKSTKKEKNSKRQSLVKTPDANTSQDSPVFRELRSRSVKVSRKKK